MRYFTLILYIIINLFLYILNYELFNSVANVDFGFGIFGIMPIVLMQVIGLFFLGLLFYTDKIKEINKRIQIEKLETKNTLLAKDLEIKKLKETVEAVHQTEISTEAPKF